MTEPNKYISLGQILATTQQKQSNLTDTEFKDEVQKLLEKLVIQSQTSVEDDSTFSTSDNCAILRPEMKNLENEVSNHTVRFEWLSNTIKKILKCRHRIDE